jgi:hypothetical protein
VDLSLVGLDHGQVASLRQRDGMTTIIFNPLLLSFGDGDDQSLRVYAPFRRDHWHRPWGKPSHAHNNWPIQLLHRQDASCMTTPTIGSQFPIDPTPFRSLLLNNLDQSLRSRRPVMRLSVQAHELRMEAVGCINRLLHSA